MNPAMPMYDPNMAPQEQILFSSCQILRKYFGCISLRAGGVISCLTWAGFSLYFAILSFQQRSPFFSYLGNSSAFYVFGAINLIMVFFSFWCMFVLLFCKHQPRWIQSTSRLALGISFVLVLDYFVNICIFFRNSSEYSNWCLTSASRALEHGTQISDKLLITDQSAIIDYYNCNRLWEDEVKFSVVVLILMMGYYAYTAACLYSYAHKTNEMMNPATFPPFGQPPMGPPQQLPQAPPPMQPAMQPPMQPAAHKNIIVLQNTKPSSKTGSSFLSLPSFLKRKTSNMTDVTSFDHDDLEKGESDFKRKPVPL